MAHRTPTNDDQPTVVHEVTEQFEPDPEGFLKDLAAPAPNGAAPKADPTPAGDPDSGEMSESSAASGEPGAGSDAAGSGRPRLRGPDGRFIGRSRQPRRLEPPPGYDHMTVEEYERLQAQLAARGTTPAELPVSVALEHALIDVDADLFLAEQHRRLEMARTVLDAIRFGVEADRLETALAVKAGMLVRLGSDGGGS
jgi:hypothetical protein